GQELGGPRTIEAHAEFMHDDVWTVHTSYHVEMEYPQQIRVILDNQFETGIRFEGDEGWIFCTRTEEEINDPKSPTGIDVLRPLRASDPKLLSPLDAAAVRWMPSKTHHGNWLESIAANVQPIAPIQQSARSLEACCAAWIGMKLKRKLAWDAAAEKFVDDAAANALRNRKAREPKYDFELILKHAGVS
ncbi:MAG TPA: gfo/Idh/MocA family oxidoreductase, partial [Verrucomicrobiae bacterium]